MRIWQDPNAQMHGRPGQQQQGVDIFGTPKGSTRPHGVQCKRKDQLLRTLLTEKEIRAEVENAKAFSPPLEVLVIATCAPSDVALQQLARAISDEHAEAGLFAVHIFGWSEILTRLGDYPDLVAEHYGFQPIGMQVERSRAESRHAEVLSGQLDLAQQVKALASQLAGVATADGPAHAKLDACRSLIQAHACKSALTLLEQIRSDEWDQADSRLRFRISTNTAAAHLGLGHTQEAAQLFLEAYEYDQQSDKALANRAVALLLLGRDSEAVAAAREATATHPLSAVAWTALLNVVSRVDSAMPIPDPPAVLAEDPTILLTQADALATRKEWVTAEALLRKHLSLANADPIARSRLAEVIMSQIVAEGRFYAGASFSSEELCRLREASVLLRQAWDVFRRSDLAITHTHVVSNACALATVLGDMQSAEEMVAEALRAAPDNENLLSWRVRLSAFRGDGPEALRAFDRLPPNAEDRAMLEATAARAANDPSRAARVLEAWILRHPDPSESTDARCLFADAVCEADIDNAETRFCALPSSGDPAVARSTVIFARALRQAGRLELGAAYLARARHDLEGSSDRRDRLFLADALAEFDEYAAAAAIYEAEVSTQVDTPALREFVRSLFALDQRRRLVELFRSLPEGIASKPTFLYYRAHIAVRIGDFSSARTALEQCLAASPEKLETRILWADVCLRQDDIAAASNWLRTVNPADPQYSVDQLLRVGPMLHHIGESEAATRVFYAALRRFPQDSRVHLAFTASLMFKGNREWIAPPRTATADAAVTLRDADGHERTYVLENRPESELRGDEISVDSELGRRLLGRVVGDAVVGHSSSLASHETTITSIQHKFVHAAHESMNAFNTRFPESAGLVRVRLPTTGTPEEQIQPILRALEEKSSRSQQVVSFYSRGLPIAAIGTMLGVNAIEAWRGLRGHPDRPLATCLGSEDERAAVFAQLNSANRRYVLDPIALIELQELEALEFAERVCGRLGLVQATLEELRAMIAELDAHADGYLTLFERDGRYYRHQVTARAVRAERSKLQAAYEWAKKHCEIVPAVPKVDPTPEIADGLNRALGLATQDTLLAAQGRNFVLVTDDLHLRHLALNEFKVDGIWIQAVLMLARDLRVMPRDHYDRAVYTLTSWRHHFTSISADQLLFAARRTQWRVTGELRALISTLALDRTEIRSNAHVAALFLKDLWAKGQGPTKGQARRVTEELLSAVGPEKTSNSELYLALLRRYVEAGVIPAAAWDVVVAWYRTKRLSPVRGWR